MRTLRYLIVLFVLICVFTLTVSADDGFIGDWDDLTPTETTETTVPTETEATTDLGTTEPSATETTETETTKQPESSTVEGTTSPGSRRSSYEQIRCSSLCMAVLYGG